MSNKQEPEQEPEPPSRAPRQRRGGGESRSDVVPIRRIGATFRPQVAIHLLALDEHDRYLRFGYAASDEKIRDYVEGIDYARDHVYGIFNRSLRLIAMAHLAEMENSGADKSAEFGVSVLKHARGRGYGTLLFERAATHAVNSGIDKLYIYALSENVAMLHIAQKAGAVIEHMGGESEACVHLPGPTFRSLLEESLASHVGYVDYWLKAEARALRRRFSGKNGDTQDRDTMVPDVDPD
ncbi:MAG: GNAT family N-acetyltransferase [Ottowia sp.]|nr:GNAT family N-acetyltransferase [Ottowia sp.]